jgi:hypothetical protein
MPPQLPNNQQQNPRHRVVAVMTAAQEDALHQLRRDGVPEAQALAVMQRISSLCLQTLRELDHVYREFEELLAHNPDRTAAHQEWLDMRAGGLLLTLEAFIAALVAEAINAAKETYRDDISRRQEVIIPAPPQPSLWEEAQQNLGRLLRNPFVLWAVSTATSFCVGLLLSGSTTWGLIAMGFTAFVVFIFEKAGLIFISIAGGVCLLLWLLGGGG